MLRSIDSSSFFSATGSKLYLHFSLRSPITHSRLVIAVLILSDPLDNLLGFVFAGH